MLFSPAHGSTLCMTDARYDEGSTLRPQYFWLMGFRNRGVAQCILERPCAFYDIFRYVLRPRDGSSDCTLIISLNPEFLIK